MAELNLLLRLSQPAPLTVLSASEYLCCLVRKAALAAMHISKCLPETHWGAASHETSGNGLLLVQLLMDLGYRVCALQEMQEPQ